MQTDGWVFVDHNRFSLVDDGTDIVLEQQKIKVKLTWFKPPKIVELETPNEAGWSKYHLLNALRKEFEKERNLRKMHNIVYLKELTKEGGDVFTINFKMQEPKEASSSVGSVTVSGRGQAAGIVHGGMVMHQGPKQEGHWHY